MTDLVDYLRRRGMQCNRQQPIVPCAGTELLKAADRIETLEAEITRLQRELGNQPRVRMCEPKE